LITNNVGKEKIIAADTNNAAVKTWEAERVNWYLGQHK